MKTFDAIKEATKTVDRHLCEVEKLGNRMRISELLRWNSGDFGGILWRRGMVKSKR